MLGRAGVRRDRTRIRKVPMPAARWFGSLRPLVRGSEGGRGCKRNHGAEASLRSRLPNIARVRQIPARLPVSRPLATQTCRSMPTCTRSFAARSGRSALLAGLAALAEPASGAATARARARAASVCSGPGPALSPPPRPPVAPRALNPGGPSTMGPHFREGHTAILTALRTLPACRRAGASLQTQL